MTVSTSYRRLFLRCVRQDANARNLRFSEVFDELAIAQVRKTAGGLTIVAASGNGQTYNVLPNAGAGMDPFSFAEMLEDMITRHDDAKAALIADGTASPTDAQIFDEMFAHLTEIRDVVPDFSAPTQL